MSTTFIIKNILQSSNESVANHYSGTKSKIRSVLSFILAFLTQEPMLANRCSNCKNGHEFLSYSLFFLKNFYSFICFPYCFSTTWLQKLQGCFGELTPAYILATSLWLWANCCTCPCSNSSFINSNIVTLYLNNYCLH